jgi:dihydroorotate dehydrogenase
VTSRPEGGNPPPGLHRLPEQRALINRMGFNNDGRAYRRAHFIANNSVGVNIGKNRDVGCVMRQAITQTRPQSFTDERIFVLNVSSPNTPGFENFKTGGF